MRTHLGVLGCAAMCLGFAAGLQAQTLKIATTSPLPSGITGQSYSVTLVATGGTSPYQWAVGTGMPLGLSLNTASGAITGTPTTAGSYSFTAGVQDSTGTIAGGTFAITIVPPLQIVTQPPLFNGQTGAPYSQLFSASGGFPPYTWSVSGNTGGLTLDSSTGLLSGTPPSVGTFAFTVKVTDSAKNSISTNYSITVTAPALIITAGGSLSGGTVGVAYDQKFSVVATGGTPPYAWSLASGSVPGLTFNPSTVELSGTPTTAGTYSLTLQVTDSAKATATRSFSLTIGAAALSITSSRQLTTAQINVPYSQTLAAVGGVPPYTWSANGLPAGLTIGSSGVISGTPTAAGSFTAVITVTDSALSNARDNFSLQVSLPALPSVTISGLTSTAGPAQQFPLKIALGGNFPVVLQGQLILSFQPTTGPKDSTIQFSTGGTTANFTIPVGSTAATFLDSFGQAVSQLQMQTGTAAGTITASLSGLTAGGVDVTPTPAPSISTQIAAAAPVIGSVTVVRNADVTTGCAQGQICLQVTGYATSREVTLATFVFQAASGQSLQSAAGSIAVDVTSLFSTWFGSSTMGSQFVFVQPFKVSPGDPANVIPVSVTLTNRVGTTTKTVGQ